MRYLRADELQIPVDWTAKAETAMGLVRDAASADRIAVIGANSLVWTAVKEGMARLSADRCWYCESRRSRSDYAIDHFRPKGRVLEDPDHPGYWWLAFRVENFRYCCTFCNSVRRDSETDTYGGKGVSFPLIDENCRAQTETYDLNVEMPLLLDPLNERDPKLLYFEADGRVAPAYDQSTNARDCKRAEVSIKTYHLNYSGLKRARKRLYDGINSLISEGDRYFSPGPSDDRVDYAREKVIERVLHLQSLEVQYWAATQQFLTRVRDPQRRPWLEVAL
jgi:uncharacterized protein (TIGR02646 family)